MRERSITYGKYPIFSFIKRLPGKYFLCVWENNIQYLYHLEPPIKKDHISKQEVLEISKDYGFSEDNYQEYLSKKESWNAVFIRTYIRRLEAQRKFNKPKDNSDFVFVEFLYSPEWEWMLARKRWVWRRHRIVKKTEKTVFVERDPYQGSSFVTTGWQAFVVYTFMLNRAELEANHQYHHKTYHKTFFEKCVVPELNHKRFIGYDLFDESYFEGEYSTDDVIEIPVNGIQWALDDLNITHWPITKEQINKIYKRLAMKFHPERKGGSHKAMVRINVARDFLLGELE
ncbi:MAG: hypothetical protein ACXWUD_05155 [Methylosarcina sp.]